MLYTLTYIYILKCILYMHIFYFFNYFLYILNIKIINKILSYILF